MVVPLSRSKMLPRVRGNLKRQNFKHRVCVVENGEARGACKAAGFQPDVLLTSDEHQSHARNTALAWLRQHAPDAYWVAFDDDDYYGPEYVAEHAGLAKHGQLVGKSTHWVLFEDWFLALFRPWESSGRGEICNGATIGAFVSESPEFPILDVGEDNDFARRFSAKGGKIYLSSPYHTAYCRRGNGRDEHTFQATHESFIRVMGNSYMVFAPDRLDLVEAKNPVEGGELMSYPRLPSKNLR